MRDSLSKIGVVGAGTAGLAAAALLARAGHHVEVLERAPSPGPVGAGLLLQPTGIAVLQRLGVLEEVTAGAAWVSEVHGTTVEGRRFMDLAYARLGEGVHGLGVHRGALFTALRGAAQRAGAGILPGVEVVRRVDRTLIDAGGARYGPFAWIVGAERSGDERSARGSGARSTMRRSCPVRARIHEHRWGAPWGVFEDRAPRSRDVWTRCRRHTARSRSGAGTTGHWSCSATPRTRSARSSDRARTSR